LTTRPLATGLGEASALAALGDAAGEAAGFGLAAVTGLAAAELAAAAGLLAGDGDGAVGLLELAVGAGALVGGDGAADWQPTPTASKQAMLVPTKPRRAPFRRRASE